MEDTVLTKEPGVHANDCLVTDNSVTSARNLIQGYPLTPINFADLCNLIENVVLHERIIMTLPTLQNSPLESLVIQGIVSSTMFTDATPPAETGKQYVKGIYETCLNALGNASTFGRGIINVPDPNEEAEKAIARISIADIILRYERGARIEPGAEKHLRKVYKSYSVFKDYIDAVFSGARYFHVHAYTGASEVPCAIQNLVKSVPQALYQKLKELHKERVDSFLTETGFHSYEIPPFALIVLSRCKSRDDIVTQMLAARDEFADFRNTCTKYATDLKEAATNGTSEDIIQLHNDVDAAVALLTKKARASQNDSRFVYRVWDVVKAATPLGIARNLLDYLKEYDIDRQTLRSVNGLLDVWSKMKKASSYEKILRSELLGKFQEDEFVAFNNYLGHVQQYVAVPVTRKPLVKGK